MGKKRKTKTKKEKSNKEKSDKKKIVKEKSSKNENVKEKSTKEKRGKKKKKSTKSGKKQMSKREGKSMTVKSANSPPPGKSAKGGGGKETTTTKTTTKTTTSTNTAKDKSSRGKRKNTKHQSPPPSKSSTEPEKTTKTEKSNGNVKKTDIKTEPPPGSNLYAKGDEAQPQKEPVKSPERGKDTEKQQKQQTFGLGGKSQSKAPPPPPPSRHGSPLSAFFANPDSPVNERGSYTNAASGKAASKTVYRVSSDAFQNPMFYNEKDEKEIQTKDGGSGPAQKEGNSYGKDISGTSKEQGKDSGASPSSGPPTGGSELDSSLSLPILMVTPSAVNAGQDTSSQLRAFDSEGTSWATAKEDTASGQGPPEQGKGQEKTKEVPTGQMQQKQPEQAQKGQPTEGKEEKTQKEEPGKSTSSGKGKTQSEWQAKNKESEKQTKTKAKSQEMKEKETQTKTQNEPKKEKQTEAQKTKSQPAKSEKRQKTQSKGNPKWGAKEEVRQQTEGNKGKTQSGEKTGKDSETKEVPSESKSQQSEGKSQGGSGPGGEPDSGKGKSSSETSVTGGNYLLSTSALFSGKCGSGARERASSSGKRYLLSARSCRDGSLTPIGILYGPIRNYLNARNSVTHVLLRTGLLKEEPNDVALDACLIDDADKEKVSQIYKVETQENLLTLTTSNSGRLFVYDKTGRGIEMCGKECNMILDGEKMTLVVANVEAEEAPSKSSKSASSPHTCPLKLSHVDRSRATDEQKTHKMEISSGTAMLLLCAVNGGRDGSGSSGETQQTQPKQQEQPKSQQSKSDSAKRQKQKQGDSQKQQQNGSSEKQSTKSQQQKGGDSSDAKAHRMELLLVVQDERDSLIAIDELLLWDPRQDLAEAQQSRVDAVQVKFIDLSQQGAFPAVNYESAEIGDFPLEYMVIIRPKSDEGLKFVGLLAGSVNGLIKSPPATLRGSWDGDSLLVHLQLMDAHDAWLGEQRRRVLSTKAEELVTVTVAGKATVYLCGDKGGGWIIGAGSKMILACERLVQLGGCRSSDGGNEPPKMGTGEVHEVKGQRARRFAVSKGEVTLLLTEGASTLAFYVH